MRVSVRERARACVRVSVRERAYVETCVYKRACVSLRA